MGSEKVTIKNLEVIEVDVENNKVLLKGAVPGAKGTLVLVKSDAKIAELKTEEEKQQEEKKEEEAQRQKEIEKEKALEKMATKEEDIVKHFFVTNTLNDLLFFTNRGRVFQLKAYEIPKTTRTAKGQSIANFLQLAAEEKVTALVSSDNFQQSY